MKRRKYRKLSGGCLLAVPSIGSYLMKRILNGSSTSLHTPGSTLNLVVPNETAPHRIEVAMIFDLLAGNSLACAFWCIEFVSFHIVSWASKPFIPQLHFC